MSIISTWKRLGWLTQFLILAAVLAYPTILGFNYLNGKGIIGGKNKDSVQLEKATQEQNIILTSAPSNYKTVGLTMAPLPSSTVVRDATRVSIEYWGMAWQSQAGFALANGGPLTTEGSMYDKAKINFKFIRQDMYDKMAEKMLDIAKQFEDDPEGTPIYMLGIMGDGMVTFGAPLMARLQEINPDFRPVGIFTPGFSDGEDKFIGPYEWRIDPQKARGGICVVYLKDGDHNLALKWAADNAVPVNPDPTTWSANALNFVSAEDFLDAARKYNARKSNKVELTEVITDENGKVIKRGEKVFKEINSVSTWLPGDEKVFSGSPNDDIVNLMSTRENRMQMPCLVIGLNKQLEMHRGDVEKFIWTSLQASDQIKTYDGALRFACKAQGEIYSEGAENNGQFWYEYYRGKTITTQFGRQVILGGSRAANLADNAELFGLSGGVNRYEAVFNYFGNYMARLYPEDVPTVPDINEMLDLSYLQNVYTKYKSNMTTADEPQMAPGGIVDKVSDRSYKVEFSSGSAQLTAEGIKTLNEMYQSLAVSDLKIQVYGHTDSDGDEGSNMELSQKRADAVKYFLIKKGIDPKRFTDVMGYGESNPIAENSTANGKQKNRRVEVETGM